MGSYTIKSAVALFALMMSGLFAASWASAAAPVGVTVYAEEWTPSRIDSETLKVIANNPTLVSDTLDMAWDAFRQWYLGTIPQILQQQNYLHTVDGSIPTGISLYDRKGNTHLPPEMTLPVRPEFSIKSDGPSTLRVNFVVPGTSISLCATTPTKLGTYGDPCATFSVDVSMGMAIQLSDIPGRLLTITTANVATSNFKVLDPNLPTEIIQGLAAVYAYLGGPNYQATLVKAIDTEKINVTSQLQAPVNKLNGIIAGYEQSALTSINQLLQPAASVDRLIHLALLVQPSGGGKTLAILLTPPTTGVNLNPAGMNGQFKGILSFDDSVKNPPASCSLLDGYPQIKGQVQTGPRGVVSFDGINAVYGTAPMQGLNLQFRGDENPLSASRSCPYTVENLALGFPNVLNFSSFNFKATGQAQISTNLEIQPSHWSNPVIVGPNGVIVSTGTTTASTPANVSRQVQSGNFTRFGAATTAGSPGGGTSSGPARSWTAANPQSTQTGAQMNLVASQGVSFQPGAGAIPQRAHIGIVNTGDPLANKLAGQAAQVQGAPLPALNQSRKVPNWGGTALGTAPAGSSTMRVAPANTSIKPIQTVPPGSATATAPSSLTTP